MYSRSHRLGRLSFAILALPLSCTLDLVVHAAQDSTTRFQTPPAPVLLAALGPDGKAYAVRMDASGGLIMSGVAGVSSGTSINWRGTYSSANTYAIGDAVTLNGSSYLAIAASNSSSPQNPATATSYWGLLALAGANGTSGQGFAFKGAWTASTAYNLYDVLTYSGSAYVVTTAFTSGTSFSTTNLNLLASAGASIAPPTNYLSANTYAQYALVTFQSVVYQALQPVPISMPPVAGTTTAYWAPVADGAGAASAVAAKTINGKAISSSPVLNAFDVGAVAGPVAGSSKYYENLAQTSIDTMQGFITYFVPNASGSLQLVFGNSAQSGEVTCGPRLTVRAGIEYPVDSGNIVPVFFRGVRDGALDPCGMLISDVINVDTSASAQVLQARFRVIRNPADTAAIPTNWNFGQIAGSAVLAPYTTTKANGYWDGVEMLTTRTVTDGVATAASTAFSSATANFTLQDVGQTITIAGAGASGAALTTTIAARSSATAVTLAVAASTTVSAATTTLAASDKTTSGTIVTGANLAAYAPQVLLGKPSGVVKSVNCVGDSITDGYLNLLLTGSWCPQALDQAGVAAGLATLVHTGIPYINVSQIGELVGNLASPTKHMNRLALLGRSKYTIGMLGTNDYIAGIPATTIENNLLTWAADMRRAGTQPFYGTLTPRSTSTTAWIDLAGQTVAVTATEANRVAENTWLRDGAPIDNTTLLAVAPGTSPTTSSRTNYYDVTGAIAVAASGASASQHPLVGAFELADSVESSRNSGLWKVDPGVRTLTNCSITSGQQALTCSSGTFTSADVNRWISVPGAGASGANLLAYITGYTSATQVTSGLAAQTTVSGASVLVDGGPNTSSTSGRCSSDGLHPTARCYRDMSVPAAALVNTFTW